MDFQVRCWRCQLLIEVFRQGNPNHRDLARRATLAFVANGLFQHSLGQRPRNREKPKELLAEGHLQCDVNGVNMAGGQTDSFVLHSKGVALGYGEHGRWLTVQV